jgi:hypothetical protein
LIRSRGHERDCSEGIADSTRSDLHSGDALRMIVIHPKRFTSFPASFPMVWHAFFV